MGLQALMVVVAWGERQKERMICLGLLELPGTREGSGRMDRYALGIGMV